MEQKIQTQKHKMKCGFAIKLLSIIALVCMVAGYVTSLGSYTDHDYGSNYRSTIFMALNLAPVILFVIYSFGFHSKLQATFIVPLVFGVTVVNYVVYDALYALLSIPDILTVVACILAIISALQGFRNKKLLVAAMSAVLLFAGVVQMIEIIHDAIRGYFDCLYTLQSLLICLGECALYAALFLFGLNNTIPAIINGLSGKAKGKTIQMDPEVELNTLNEQYALGKLTQEEYETQRAEILRRI